MSHFDQFKVTGYTYEERTTPEAFTSALGEMAVSFSKLEDELSGAIAILLSSPYGIGQVVTAELSFRNKVHLMASLVKQLSGKRPFNFSADDLVEGVNELAANCFRAEELRNQLLHSSFVYDRTLRSMFRKKITAKSSAGLRSIQQEVNAAYILDVSDFIIMVAQDVEEFMFDPGSE
ncbi:MAG: hypothetical protein HY255_02235 [Betaproteobacteria bacterium]|nr:hypothetical protein [Betaproteobacteria bacterium]